MKNINASKKTAITIGILFIIATLFLFIGEAFYKPILGSSDYLSIAYPQRITAVTGILIEFICVISMPLIAIFFYPILKKFNETLAIGYVVFRFFEGVLFVGDEIKYLSLIGLSQKFLNSDGVKAENIQSIGASILNEISWGFSIYVIVFAIGALMLYVVLYQSKLIPRWLSGWGLFAAILILIGAVLSLFGLESVTTLELIFILPIAIQEMVMAGWFIVKGFNPSVIVPTSRK